MSAPVDVLAVMDDEIASLPEMASMASVDGVECDPTEAIARMAEARAAVADLLLEGERLMKGLDSVSGMTVVQPHDVANFKIALARVTGAQP